MSPAAGFGSLFRKMDTQVSREGCRTQSMAFSNGFPVLARGGGGGGGGTEEQLQGQ